MDRLLSPSESPQEADNDHKIRGIGSKPAWIAGTVILVVLAVIVYGLNRRSSAPVGANQDDHGGTAIHHAEETAGNYTAGTIPPYVPPTPPLPPVPQTTPTDAPTLPEPAAASTPNEELRRRQEAYLAAVKAKTSVDLPALNQPKQAVAQVSDGTLRKQDPNNLYPTDLSQYHNEAPSAPPMNADANQYNLSNFSGSEYTDRWTLHSRHQYATSRYLIRAGAVFPAILKTEMNNGLPGFIMAQVSENICDTATGQYVLIPQGSQLLGEYVNQATYGQKRIFAAWERITFPDGSVFDIGAFPGADATGAAGFQDHVNNHFWSMFGSAILMSGITAGVSLSQPHGNNYSGNGVSATDALSQALGQTLGTAMSELFQKNLNVQPTLVIRPGFRLNVIVAKDLYLDKSYKTLR